MAGFSARKPFGSLTDISIAALATQCGFADATHATRTFRSFLGIAPRDFRKG